MLFMVIERFKNSDAKAVYRRYRRQGRLMPEGLNYVQSWVSTSFDCCFQLMESNDARLFDEWVSQWQDLVEFEIIPVVTSKEAAEAMNKII